MGARRVTQKAARSWVRGNGMRSMGSARRTLMRSEEAFMVDIGLSGGKRYGIDCFMGLHVLS